MPLATARPAKMNTTNRNPTTNACETADRTAAAVFSSRLVGNVRAASLVSFAWISRRTFDGSEKLVRLRFKWELNAVTITTPNTAIASTPATRATALLIPEAVPAWSWSTELITTVVSGATVIAIPKPRTTNPGKNVFQ